MGHHYVPQKYLQGFAHPARPGVLWQFDKQSQNFSREPVAIKSIAQERSFYDPETEKQLNDLVEGPANAVLDKLRLGDLTIGDEERAHLSVYIATMVNRIPRHRAKGREMAPGVLAKVSAELREQIKSLEAAGRISADLAERHRAAADEAEAELAIDIPPSVERKIRSPWPSDQMIATVSGMHWRFVRSGVDQHFLTSDNPAFFFECYGLGTERSELTFPISRDLALFGSWTPLSGNRKIAREAQFVKESNRRLVIAATRFVYSGTKAEWVGRVATKGKSALSRIQW
jgi:hypothetical protein